jgi:hypothetical protein
MQGATREVPWNDPGTIPVTQIGSLICWSATVLFTTTLKEYTWFRRWLLELKKVVVGWPRRLWTTLLARLGRRSRQVPDHRLFLGNKPTRCCCYCISQWSPLVHFSLFRIQLNISKFLFLFFLYADCLIFINIRYIMNEFLMRRSRETKFRENWPQPVNSTRVFEPQSSW